MSTFTSLALSLSVLPAVRNPRHLLRQHVGLQRGLEAFAQHPEEFPAGKHGGPRDVEEAFARAGLGLPAEWTWARSLSADATGTA